MHNLQHVDSKELGEAIDMIKDLEEAIYYKTITDAMTKKSENEHRYYPKDDYDKRYMMPYYRDMDRPYGKMYYGGDGDTSSMAYPYELGMRDFREGRSPMTRRSYMEAKEMHMDKSHQMKELEKYVSELTKDIVEMVEDASPEE
jgi:hypothetical protein